MSPTIRTTTAFTHCTLCPRNCGVDRTADASGYCRSSATPRLASAVLHRGEEPSLVTGLGSGAMFFSGCTLRCGSCQNCQISTDGDGADVDVEQLSEIMLRLQSAGASNINLVTGTHFSPAIIDAVRIARTNGLVLPTVWNSSGYEKIDTLELLDDCIDIWLPDVKTFDCEFAGLLMNAPDYPERAREATLWMASRGAPVYENERLVSGTIVRHLVMPGLMDDTEQVIRWYSMNLKNAAHLSVMAQYVPVSNEPQTIRRQLAKSEYEAVVSLLVRYEIENGYIQELEHGTDWLPDFSRANPFPREHVVPVWSQYTGFIEHDA